MNELQEIAERKLGEKIVEIRQFVDDDLNKKYDVYYLKTECKNEFVMKKPELTREYEIYETIIKTSKIKTPKYLGREEKWIFLEFISGNDIRNNDYESFEKAVIEMARMHLEFWGKDLGDIVKDRNLFNKYDGIVEKNENKLDKKLVEAYRIAKKELNRNFTFIQDDLLPINILEDETGDIYIIDFTMATEGSFALDIARFLGAFKNCTELWVREEWTEKLKNTYYEIIKDKISRDEFELQFLCALFYDSFKIFIYLLEEVNKGTLSDKNWFKLNFDLSIKRANNILLF